MTGGPLHDCSPKWLLLCASRLEYVFFGWMEFVVERNLVPFGFDRPHI
jgi:hypothetical protein